MSDIPAGLFRGAGDVAERVRLADVVFASDPATGERAVVYGRELLGRCVAEGISVRANVLEVFLGFGAGRLDALLALVQAVKGRHCYGSTRESNN